MGGRKRSRKQSKKWKDYNALQVRDIVRSDRLHAKQKEALNRDWSSPTPKEKGSSLFVWHLVNRPTHVPAEQIYYFFQRYGPVTSAKYIRNNKNCLVTFADPAAARSILEKSTTTPEGKRRLDTPGSAIGHQGFVLIDEAAGQNASATTVHKSGGANTRLESSFVGMGVCVRPAAEEQRVEFYQEVQENDMTLNFNFRKRFLQWASNERLYELRFKHMFDRLTVVHDSNHNTMGLLISFKHTPLVFRFVDGFGIGELWRFPPEDDPDPFTDDQNERDKIWSRCGDWTPTLSLQRCGAVLIMLGIKATADFRNNHSLLLRLVNYGLLPDVEEPGGLDAPLAVNRSILDMTKIENVSTNLNRELSCIGRRIGHSVRAAFDARILSQWNLGQDMEEFFALLKRHPADIVERTMWMLQAGGRPLDGNAIARIEELLAAESELYEAPTKPSDLEELLPNFCVQLPRLLATPTRMLLLQSEVEVSNRMVRHLMRDGLDSLDFLRVSFGEEDGGRFLSGTSTSEAFDERMEALPRHGILINGRKYEFLGYSSSQLKELGMWFLHFGSTNHRWNTKKVWEWIGDLDTIKLPSKFAARMGQAFSTTVSTVPLTSSGGSPLPCQRQDEVQDEGFTGAYGIDIDEDIKRNGRVFTDGSGTISKEQLEACLKQVPFAADRPSDVGIVQVRIGGAKGTLVLDPQLPRVGACGDSVHCVLRKSMVKFEAPFGTVEVVSVGKQLPYYLNQSIIAMLETHGVPAHTFEELQSRQLRMLDSILQSAAAAAVALPRVMDGSHFLYQPFLCMLQSGLEPRKEPFLFSCLSALRSHQVQRIRCKANIFVEQGTVLMGAPSALVPEGKVFLQVRRGSAEQGCSLTAGFDVVTGPVLIAKHPVYHPGDVRQLEAVDIPALKAIRNVLLFSTHGSRPEADKLSGSDYDGDLFSVTWNPKLFLSGGNGEPMDYPPPAPPPMVGKIEPEHLVKHFIDHAKNDNIGRIANAIIAIGDRSRLHQNDPKCLELAQLASMAVDFPKSGVPATLKDKRHLVPEQYPHFMQKKNKISYQSNRALGRLFNDVSKYERDLATLEQAAPAAMDRWIGHGRLGVYSNSPTASCLRQVLNLNIVDSFHDLFGLRCSPHSSEVGDGDSDDGVDTRFSSFLKSLQGSTIAARMWWTAVQNREECERSFKELMNKYRLHCEGELLTGCIRKFHRLHKRRQHDLAEQVRMEVRETCQQVRRSFLVAAAELANASMSADGSQPRDDLTAKQLEAELGGENSLLLRQQLAACCYLCTYHPQARAARETDDSDLLLFAFPWICAPAELCSLARGCSEHTHSTRSHGGPAAAPAPPALDGNELRQ